MKISQIKYNQKYIVVCVKDVPRSKVGLGSSGRYVKGEYVTRSGVPTHDPNDSRKPAFVYVRGKEDFPFDVIKDFFEPVPVDVVIVLK